MKRKIQLFMGLLCLAGSAQAQCTGGIFGGVISPGQNWAAMFVNAGVYLEFSASAGNSYHFSFCQGGGSAGFDTQITILDHNGNFAGGYNDDFCGLSSDLVWNATTTGTYQILISQYYCNPSGAFALLAYREMPPPGPGATCATAIPIASLPYSASGLSTCGAGNEYNSSGPCANGYMNGEDFVFRYTATSAQIISISLSNTLGSTGIFVVDGCPGQPGTNCIAASGGSNSCAYGNWPNTSLSGNPSATFPLPAAGIYYLIVDTWPNPTCTPFDISVEISTPPPAPTVCYSTSTIPYAPDNFNTGTAIQFPDDEFSPVISLPFPFCFMGTTHTSLVVSSNAYLSFNTNCSGLYSPWDTQVIPSPGTAGIKNSIMGPWVDIDPGVSGTIKYATYGTAPYRRFVVSFRNVAMYSSACNSLRFTGQITLYETTNIIENHIMNLPNCPGWNDGEAVLGLLDPTGTQAVTPGGMNNTQFSLTNYALRYSPSCTQCATVLPVAFGELSGTRKGPSNEIRFTTQYESGIRNFSLEKSSDGLHFEKLGGISASNSSKGNQYILMDEQPFYPQTLYRILAQDQNGTENYSEVISVSGGESGLALLGILPEKEGGNLHFSFENGGMETRLDLSITDLSGREVMRKAIAVSSGRMEASILMGPEPSGIYLATLSDGKGFRQTRKFSFL